MTTRTKIPLQNPLADSGERVAAREASKARTIAEMLGAPADFTAVDLSLTQLTPDPFQPRKSLNQATLRSLAASIHADGVLQSLVVRPAQGPNTQGKYWIVAGQRRFLAAQLAGLKEVPCVIRKFTNNQALISGLVENIHREDLSDIDKAEALVRLKAMTDQTWAQIATMVKLSEVYVKQMASMVGLEDEVKELARAGDLSTRQCLVLRPVGPTKQIEFAQLAAAEDIPAERLKGMVAPYVPERRPATRTPAPPVAFVPPPPVEEPFEAAAGDAGPLLSGTGDLTSWTPPENRRKDGQIVVALRGYTGMFKQVLGWVKGREWAPSRISPAQLEELDALYHTTSELLQELSAIRRQAQDAAQAKQERIEGAERVEFFQDVLSKLSA